MYELVYTSTPQGLLTGRSGFTTVAITEGFPPNLIASIENLSGYKTLFEHGSEHELRNPVNFSCQPFTLGRTSYMVLSRISYAGISYTGRNNVLAHHLIFTGEELDGIPGGAAAVLRAEENFPEWSGKPRMLPAKQRIGSRPLPHDAEMWQKLAGSSQWAGYTAECFRANPDKGLVLAFDPLRISGAEILELIAETAARLTQDELRHFTFSTYCYSSGITNPLFFRSFVNDSARLGSIRRLEPDSIIHLGTDNPLPRAWTEKELAPCIEADPVCPTGETVREPVSFSVNQAPAPAAAPQPRTGFPNEPVQTMRFSTPPGNENESSPEPVKKQQEPPEGKPKNRRHIVAVLIAILALGLCAAVCWRIYISQPTPRQEDAPDGVSLHGKENTEESAVPQPPKTETESQTPASGQPADSVQSDPVPENPGPQSTTGKPTAPKTVHQKASRPDPAQTSQMEVELYRHFRKGGKHKLPAFLRGTVDLEVKLLSIGGMDDIGDLKQFVDSIKRRRVEIYARLQKPSSGLGDDWVPDKTNVKNRMIFQLVGKDSLEITYPADASKTSPKLADVKTITFVLSDGTTYVFYPNQPPLGMTEFLNREIAITVERVRDTISFHMKVSDDLWESRAFYLITVKGSNSDVGKINGRNIPLHTVDLNGVKSDLVRRNRQVDQFRQYKREKEGFEIQHKQDLVPPELKDEWLQNKYDDREEFKKLQTAMTDSEKWNQLKAAIERERRNLLLEQTPPLPKRKIDNKIKEVTADLDRFRAQCIKRQECQDQLAEKRKKVEDCLNELKKQNTSLLKKLKDCSQTLYNAACKTLEESNDPQILDLGFDRPNFEQELKNDIKVVIIRKDANEFR